MSNEQDLSVLVAKIKRFQKNTLKGSHEVTLVWTYRLRDLIRQRAPRKTGEYASTIVVYDHNITGALGREGFETGVTSDHPAAHRLEKGFYGEDAIGRTYHQAPIPHWRPSYDEIMPRHKQAIKDEIPRWWK